jgi:hypothetical protein
MYNLIESNNKIIELIELNKPFYITRLGDNVSKISIQYIISQKVNINLLQKDYSLYNDGIYSKNDLSKIELFCKMYNKSVIESNYLASFESLYVENQNFYKNNFNVNQIYSRVLEPFYLLDKNVIPWTHYLKTKKVLIIHPFINSFKKQLNNNFQIFKDKVLFDKNQQFVFYKSYQTIAGNHIHNDWYETFNLMCEDIKYIDFDIALLGCGGYGLPLCHFIKTELNKSAIYIGGGLQLLFGVFGGRWENSEFWKKIIEENDCKFIRPCEDEICKNSNTIENNCYW